MAKKTKKTEFAPDVADPTAEKTAPSERLAETEAKAEAIGVRPDAVEKDLAQLTGDLERVLKAIGVETVDQALTELAAHDNSVAWRIKYQQVLARATRLDESLRRRGMTA